MPMHLKFKHVFPGQIIEPVTRIKINDYQIFMKIPDPEKMKVGACACGNDEWNAVNVNGNGIFTVHFHPDDEVIVTPGQNAYQDLKRKMKDYIVTTDFNPPLGSAAQCRQCNKRPTVQIDDWLYCDDHKALAL